MNPLRGQLDDRGPIGNLVLAGFSNLRSIKSDEIFPRLGRSQATWKDMENPLGSSISRPEGNEVENTMFYSSNFILHKVVVH